MENLSGKVAMVTGGATGIGAGIVERLTAAGADVACCYNASAEAAWSLSADLASRGTEIMTVKVDVRNAGEVKAAVDTVTDHFRRPVNILVNNAGGPMLARTVPELDEESWAWVIGVNLTGAFLCSKYCIPSMKTADSGRIINITSISARTGGGPGNVPYVAGKAGLEGFTRALAKEVAPFNITVNGVAPGVIHTPIHERFNTPESLERLRQTIPIARIGEPEDVAGVVAFLASDDASYVTGEIIAVNGGMRMD